MKWQTLERTATGVIAICALVATATAAHREFTHPAPPAPRAPSTEPHWKDYASTGHRMGPDAAPVTITEFADFQCPYCRRLYYALDTLRRAYPTDVKLVFRQFPLISIHRSARGAAFASECAAAEGRFEQMYDQLYQHQDSLGRITWTGYAARAGVSDTIVFNRCMADSTPRAVLSADSAAAIRLHLSGTPTVLVNDVRLPGTPSRAILDSVIKSQIVMAVKAAGAGK